MAAMELASLAWRSAHHAKGRYRHLLASDEQGTQELTDAGRDRTLRKLAEAEAVEPATLARFQEACHRVGALRAELERAGGANYRSSSGMPASAASSGSGREGSVTSDLSVTHCPEGHALVLDNLNFTAQGQRRCRSCMTQSAIRGQEKRGVRKNSRPQSGTGRGPVPAEVIDKARQMLTDPANRMSIKKIAEAVGVSSSVLYARAADAIAARRAIPATREQPALVSA
jgi:hypothetical protein